ncbi:MAG: hypothetical protein ACI90V_006487 [Bacillariaceae sp.]|jgi:hypothetical protein
MVENSQKRFTFDIVFNAIITLNRNSVFELDKRYHHCQALLPRPMHSTVDDTVHT